MDEKDTTGDNLKNNFGEEDDLIFDNDQFDYDLSG